MDTKKVDMSYSGSDCSPCTSLYDNKYPIGFFLNPKQVDALGIPAEVEPGTTMEIVATVKINSVTRREGQVECYACVTEMGIVPASSAAKATPNATMAKAYGKGEGENGD